MLVEKEISRVNIGCYIVKVLKQRGDNKEFQFGWVRDFQTIEYLIDIGIIRVLVDTNKTLPEYQKDSGQPISKINNHSPRPPLSFSEQLSTAKELFERATEVQHSLLLGVTSGNALELNRILPIIGEITELTYDNCDALICILSLRNKDHYHLEHAVAVTVLMLVFTRHIGVERSVAEELAIGAFIHDIGKAFVDETIINKAGAVSAVEFEVLKSHVNQSINIIKSTFGVPKLAQQIVAQHHEKLDGSGYPKGFDSRVISRYARMLTICDIYDALTTSRVYKPKQSQVQAFATLMEMANKNLLDLTLVNRFIKCLGVYPVGSLVKLNNGQLAIVESGNQELPLRPRIRALYNIRQKHYINTVNLDLSEENKLEIERVVDASEFDLDINKIIEFVIFDG